MHRNIIYDGERWERVSDAVAARLEASRDIVRCTGNCDDLYAGHRTPIRDRDHVFHPLSDWGDLVLAELRAVDSDAQWIATARCQHCGEYLGDNGCVTVGCPETNCEHDWQEQPGEPPVDVCSKCGEPRE